MTMLVKAAKQATKINIKYIEHTSIVYLGIM